MESIEQKEVESVDRVLRGLNVSCLIDLLGKLLEYELLMISGQLLPKLCIKGLLLEKERYQKLPKPLFCCDPFLFGWLVVQFFHVSGIPICTESMTLSIVFSLCPFPPDEHVEGANKAIVASLYVRNDKGKKE